MDESFHEWSAMSSGKDEKINLLEMREDLLSVLAELLQSCCGKQLAVVRALCEWLEAGCPSESWTDFLSAEEVEEFMKLKKGVSLAGKASPAFCAVKQALKEIIESKGLVGNFSA